MSDAAPVDQTAFRQAMGEFATGITVITIQREDVIHGMTANAFSSLSLDPPLVLFCVGKKTRMARLLQGVDGFAISILSADQQGIASHFAGSPAFGGDEVEILRRGPVAPLVPGSLVGLSCTIEALHEGGDHWIIVGKVVEVHEPEGGIPRPPLLFFRSRYAQLQMPREPRPVRHEHWSNDAIRIYHEEWSADLDEPADAEYIRAQIW